MRRKPLFIFGLTSFSEMVAHSFETYSDYEVVAFSAHTVSISKKEIAGRSIIPFERLQDELPASTHFFAAIEYKWLNGARAGIVSELQKAGYSPATFVHPSSVICPSVKLGCHNFLMEGVSLSFQSSLGDNNILFPQTFLGQGATLGSNNYICPRVLINRHANIGDHCYIGENTSIREGGRIEDWCYLKPCMEIVEPVISGTMHNPALRAPGYVIDRRKTEDSKFCV